MRCEKVKKWISDKLDGELSEERKKLLEAHFHRCEGCRLYAENLEKIHKNARSLEVPNIFPDYWKDFDFRLKIKISSCEQDESRRVPFFLGWKWILASAALIFVFFLSFFYLARIKTPQEVYILSFEDTFEQIYNEISSDPELEELFNSVILASLGENVDDFSRIIRSEFYETSLFWEGVTEEEMDFLEIEIKKDNKY
jgi:hypothetical protein